MIDAALAPSASLTRVMMRRFLEHRLAVIGGVVIALLCGLCAGAPLLEAAVGLDANEVDLFARFEGPSATHWLGTDELGRDVFLRLLYGGRVSLFVALAAALAAAVIGTAIGILAGYQGGWADALLMRLTDTVIALPLLPLLIVLAKVDLAKLGLPAEAAHGEAAQLWRLIAIIALFGWTTVARLVRGATLSVREREFVRAAEALGARGGRIMLVHILPNVMTPVIVATTLSMGGIVLFESVLSFLGLGVQPPMPSWGNMMTGAHELIWSNAELVLYPGGLIFMTVIAFNFLGDGLQDAFDPRAARR
jgi:peptide/nickel transport system permease protein